MKTQHLVLAGAVVCLILVGALLAGEGTRVIGVAVPVLFILALALLANPAVFVLGYVALRPLVDAAVFFPVGQFTLGTAWGAGLIAALSLYWLLVGFRRPMADMSWVAPALFVLAYALFTLVARVGDPFEAVSNLVKIASWVLLALTCEQIASTAQGQRLVTRAGTLLAVLTALVIGLAIAQNQYGAAYYAGGGSYDTVGQGPHGLASLAVLASPFIWMGAMHSGRRVAYTVLAAVLGIGIALSFVRTTFLAFAIITGWFVWWSLRSRRPEAVVTAMTAVVAVSAAVYLFQNAMLDRLADLSFLSAGDGVRFETGSGRIGIWMTLWQSATATPGAALFGQGASGSQQAFAAVSGRELWAHNDFLEFLITGGIGLLLLHIVTLGWLLLPGVRLSRDTAQSKPVRDTGALIAAVGLAYLVMAIFNGMAFYLSASLAMAMLVGLARGMERTPGATFLDTASVPGAETTHGPGTDRSAWRNPATRHQV